MSQATALFTRCLAICSAAAAFSAAAAQTPPDAPPTSGAPNANIPAASSQSGAPETAQRGRDLETIIRRLLRIKTESGAEEPKRLQLLLPPVISLSPAKGFVFGVEGDGTYRGKDPTTLVSSFFGSIA